MSPFGLPKLPGIGESPFSVAGNFIKDGLNGIKKVTKDIDDSLSSIDAELSKIGKIEDEEPTESRESSPPDYVTDDSTYRFQLDLLIDNATDLETVHLPNKGRINGQSCDCIAKHARTLRAHAKETIPIASRIGKDTRVFSELASLSDQLMLIGTKEVVESGQHDEEYLEYAGVMSRYRKSLEDLLGQVSVSYSEQCKDCPTTLNLKTFIEKRKQADVKKTNKAVEEATVSTDT
jgi:hypothetical protein